MARPTWCLRPVGPVIHSATRSILVPSVIQLRSYVRVRARVPMTQAALIIGTGSVIAYCGGKGRHRRPRVWYRSRGGALLGEDFVINTHASITAWWRHDANDSAGRRCLTDRTWRLLSAIQESWTRPGRDTSVRCGLKTRWTVCVVSAMEIHLFFVRYPVVAGGFVLSVLIWSRKGPHPATYKLSGALDTPAHPGPPLA